MDGERTWGVSLYEEYLGDGVYVDTQFGAFALTTEDGVSETNVIILEAEVAEALVNYIRRATEGPQT